MKVVLSEHVDNLGERGEVVTVSPGYARNYLLPKRLALEASAANLKLIENQKKVWLVKETREIGEAEAIAGRLAEVELVVEKKAGETGTLYGSVTTSEIAELLAAKGVEIDRRRMVLKDPIKAVGEYEVVVKLHHKVTGQVKVHVRSDRPEVEAAPEPEPAPVSEFHTDEDAD